MSLRARLIAGMGFVAVVLVVVSVVITVTTRDQLIGQIDERLTTFSPFQLDGDGNVQSVLPRFTLTDVPPLRPPIDGLERVSDVYQGIVGSDGVLTTVFVPNVGDRTYGEPDISEGDLPTNGSRVFTTGATDGDVTYRVLAQRVGDVTAITALPINDVQDTISELVLVEALGMLLILAVLGLVTWWMIRLGIRPIKEMTSTASEIAAGDLTARVPEGRARGTEAGDLAGALNQMLGHIEEALDERAASQERLRRFVSDASHELRTPVTTILGYAELYRHGGLSDDAALDDAMRRTEQEAARMGRLVEDMLVLAKLDEERPLMSQPVDLAELARDAAVDARAAWPTRAIVTHDLDAPAVIDGDNDRLRQVIANVVGNAFVHSDEDVPVEIRVTRTLSDATLEVRDEGDGMQPEVAERVTERFFRADPARSRHRGGSGLGLAIVDATMSAHGGAIAIESEPSIGTTVRLTFPSVERCRSPDRRGSLRAEMIRALCSNESVPRSHPPPDADLDATAPAESVPGHLAASVSVIDFDYDPDPLVVQAGTTVTWEWIGLSPHTVTDEAGSFDSGILVKGDTWSRTFDEIGTIQYLCTLHPDMKGSIEVVATEVAATPSRSTGDQQDGTSPRARGGSTNPTPGTAALALFDTAGSATHWVEVLTIAILTIAMLAFGAWRFFKRAAAEQAQADRRPSWRSPTTDATLVAATGPNYSDGRDEHLAKWILGGLVAFLALVTLPLMAVGVVAVATADSPDGLQARPATIVEASLAEFAITGRLNVPEGPVSVTVTNHGSIEHNLAVRELTLSTRDLEPGSSAELDLGQLTAGTYELYCTLPGHVDAGMKTTLTVLPASPDSVQS